MAERLISGCGEMANPGRNERFGGCGDEEIKLPLSFEGKKEIGWE